MIGILEYFYNTSSKLIVKTKEWMIQHAKNFNGQVIITFMNMQNR